MLHTSVDLMKVRKKTKTRNLNNHVPHLTKCTIWKKFKAHESVAYKRKVQKKAANIRNRYNKAPHLTQDIKWENDKRTRKLHIQDSSEASPFPAGDNKATRHSQNNTRKTIQYSTKHNKSQHTKEAGGPNRSP